MLVAIAPFAVLCPLGVPTEWVAVLVGSEGVALEWETLALLAAVSAWIASSLFKLELAVLPSSVVFVVLSWPISPSTFPETRRCDPTAANWSMGALRHWAPGMGGSLCHFSVEGSHAKHAVKPYTQ